MYISEIYVTWRKIIEEFPMRTLTIVCGIVEIVDIIYDRKIAMYILNNINSNNIMYHLILTNNSVYL